MKNNISKDLPWKKLARASKETIPLPFQLTLTDSDSPLLCEQVLRIVPGRRLVAFATWNDQDVVAKLFYGGDAKRHVQNDIDGIEILQNANVPSPKILYKGSAHKSRIQVILFEKIEESVNLDSIWQKRDEYLEVEVLMRSFTIELATQHVLGILQRDLHLNNFLVTDKRIYTLDGGAITQFENPLDKKTSLENLGLFFAQLGVGTELLQADLFQTYVKSRGWLVKKADTDILEAAIKTSLQDRWRRYQRKIFRNCTAFKRVDRLFKSMVYDREYQTPAFLNVLQYPDKIFTDPNTVILKNGRSTTVAKITIDNREMVIKRYNIKNVTHWLRRCLRETRAQGSWRLAQRLQLFGVATAKPIAYLDQHILGLRSKSYFLMEYLPGPHCGEYFSDDQTEKSRLEFIAKRILELFDRLSKLHLTHGDLKMTNIIIHKDQPKFIDLDGMSEHTLTGSLQRAYKKELQRFMQNWINKPDIYALFEKLLSERNNKDVAINSSVKLVIDV
jgi:tRNA A-37 threonylcarbamoyl transferase component Bud32